MAPKLKDENLTKQRWLILVTSCLINLCVGSLYAWSVFSTPMAEYLTAVQGKEYTASDLSVVFSLANAVGPVTMILGGSINDRIGPRWVILGGGFLFSGGMFLSGFAESLPWLVISYSLFLGLGMSFVYGCTINNSVKFFPDYRGLVGGITTAAYGLSSVLVPPIAKWLIADMGVCAAFRIFGIAFFCIISICALFVRRCPTDFCPVSWTPMKKHLIAPVHQEKDWKTMLRDPVFYIMLALLLCGASLGTMIISQASSLAQEVAGMALDEATFAVSLLALFNAGGRVTAGFISDKIGRIQTLTAAITLAIAGVVLLGSTKTGDSWKFMVGIALVGLCFGAWMGVFPGFTADQFGARNNSVNYGIMFTGFAAGGIIGPHMLRFFSSALGSYQSAFFAAGSFAFAGLALCLLWRPICAIMRTRST